MMVMTTMTMTMVMKMIHGEEDFDCIDDDFNDDNNTDGTEDEIILISTK